MIAAGLAFVDLHCGNLRWEDRQQHAFCMDTIAPKLSCKALRNCGAGKRLCTIHLPKHTVHRPLPCTGHLRFMKSRHDS